VSFSSRFRVLLAATWKHGKNRDGASNHIRCFLPPFFLCTVLPELEVREQRWKVHQEGLIR